MKDLIEIKNKRKAREKHFLKPDGTMIAEFYPENVHYLKDGVYEEIDNTIVENNGGLTNRQNDFQVFFQEQKQNIEIKRNDHFISMALQNSNPVKPQKLKEGNGILYADILTNVDLKYHLRPTKIKEAIILNDKDQIPELSFLIKTDLELTVNGQKVIEATNQGEPFFVMESPYMIDHTGRINYNIKYQLEKQEEDYILTLLLDQEWLKEATFPVVIDPTITNNGSDTSVYDTYIFPGDTNVDRNSSDRLKVGVDRVNGTDLTYRSLLKFELPTIGTGSQIVNANLNLIGYPSVDEFLKPVWDADERIYDIHEVTKDWSEETANWDTMHDQYNPKIESIGFLQLSRYNPVTEEVEVVRQNEFDITNLVKKWYAGTPNYGILLKADKEVYLENTLLAMAFSKDNIVEDTNPKPVLVITYRNQNGLENYMSYQTQTFTGGSSYINYYTGNLTVMMNIGKTIGGKFPANLNLVYNTNDVILNKSWNHGLGFKYDLFQTLEEVTIENNHLLEYRDADSTLHYFYKGSDLNSSTSSITRDENTYYDEDGLSLTITKDNNDYIMKTLDGIKYRFIKEEGPYWYLREITNHQGDTITIEFEGMKHRISKVTDGNGEKLELNYFPTHIYIGNPRDQVEAMMNNNQITDIYSPQVGIGLTYNEKNLIETITDSTGIKIKYEYYDTIPYRIKKISEYGLNGELGNFLTFRYGYGTTTVTDQKNRTQTFNFNTNGNAVGVTTLDGGEAIDKAYGKQYAYGEKISENDLNGRFNKITGSEPMLKTVKNYFPNSSFEEDTNIKFQTGNTVVSDVANTGKKSMKVTSSTVREVIETISVPKGKDYTFSVFMKNDHGVKIGLSYLNTDRVREKVMTRRIDNTEEFLREQITSIL